MSMRIDTTPTGFSNLVWEELKKNLAADPKKAVRLVMINDHDIRKAILAVANDIGWRAP